MSEEKVIAVETGKAESTINPYLDDGWKVKSMIAENVAVATFGRDYTRETFGAIIFVLEK